VLPLKEISFGGGGLEECRGNGGRGGWGGEGGGWGGGSSIKFSSIIPRRMACHFFFHKKQIICGCNDQCLVSIVFVVLAGREREIEVERKKGRERKRKRKRKGERERLRRREKGEQEREREREREGGD